MDRVSRQFRELGPIFGKLSCLNRITPSEYRQIAAAVTEDGLSYGGEVIAWSRKTNRNCVSEAGRLVGRARTKAARRLGGGREAADLDCYKGLAGVPIC